MGETDAVTRRSSAWATREVRAEDGVPGPDLRQRLRQLRQHRVALW
jgi:hypothetical protein